MDRDGKYTPLVDRMSTERYAGSPAGTGSGAPGMINKSLADVGVTTSSASSDNHGLKATSVVNNQTATAEAVFNSDGTQDVVSIAPDGTRTVQRSKHGLLLSTKNYGTDGTT